MFTPNQDGNSSIDEPGEVVFPEQVGEPAPEMMAMVLQC